VSSLRVGDRLATLAEVFRNPQLRRLELSWAGYYLGEWTHFVALSIYAFQSGGATAVGVLGFVRMGAAAVSLPFGGMFTDRYPRQRVLLGVYLARAGMLALTAAALAGGSPRWVVFALAALAAVAAAPVRPATLSLVPLLARTPQELVAANVSSSTLEGVGTFVGPVLGGVLAAQAGTDVAVAAAAVIYLGCAFLVSTIRREGEVAARPRIERDTLRELLGGVRTLAQDPHPRLIVLLFASQALVRGLLNVLLVVAALDLLGMGDSGVGWLNAALGAGGLVGGLAAVTLVGRRRLAGPFGLALVLWGAPIALIGAWPRVGWALVCLGIVGIGNAVLDVSGFTLMQRTVDEHLLGRVFGVFEILIAAAVAVGSALGSVQVSQIGIRPALVVTGLFLPALALLTYSRLRAIDDASLVPEQQLALISDVPLFAALPANTLERLSFRLLEVRAKAGTEIVAQGTPGELFYVINAGEVDVLHDGVLVNTLGRGDHFGEIALLNDVPRTAACVARTDVELYALNRERLVAAVGGDLRSSAAAEDVVTRRLSELGQEPTAPV
jgi:predicted MFS family arabinose efflux permease